MTTHKTECPRCHTVYPMPESKLNEPKARANCGKCRHTFFLNLHIINPKTADINTKLSAKTTTTTQSSPTTVSIDLDDDDTVSIPKVPIKKKKPASAPADQDMIFDDMADDSSEIDEINFDGLDDFIKQDITDYKPATATKTSNTHNDDDEAWLNDLLKNEDSPDIDTKSVNDRPNDDFGDILGNNYVDIIPLASYKAMDPKVLTQKAEERLARSPGQEKLAKKRSIGASLAWILGCFLLTGLLFAQYLFFNADTIAKTPQKTGFVGSLCDSLPCPKPSADTSAFEISHSIKPSQADHATDLIAIIKNTSTSDQLYPSLKITLMDKNGVAGNLAVAPSEYLNADHRLLGVNQDKRFMLTLDIDDTAITAINIEPFY